MARRIVVRPSREQKDALINNVEENFTQIHRRVTANGNSRKKEVWAEIAQKLNDMGPAEKSADQWLKCWRDIKLKVKKKVTLIRTKMQETGGGAMPEERLNRQETIIFELCEPGNVDGVQTRGILGFGSAIALPFPTEALTPAASATADNSGHADNLESCDPPFQQQAEIDISAEPAHTLSQNNVLPGNSVRPTNSVRPCNSGPEDNLLPEPSIDFTQLAPTQVPTRTPPTADLLPADNCEQPSTSSRRALREIQEPQPSHRIRSQGSNNLMNESIKMQRESLVQQKKTNEMLSQLVSNQKEIIDLLQQLRDK